jgi:acyl carrier protein
MVNTDIRFRDAAYMLLILMAVEKEFNIEITDLEACDINTFEDLIKLIQEKENDIIK